MSEEILEPTEPPIKPIIPYGYGFYKRGDKLAKTGIKDGQLADYRDPNIHDCNFSEHEKAVYLIVKVPLSKIEEWESFDFETLDDDKFKARDFIDYKDIEKETSVKLTDIRSTKAIEVLDIQDNPNLHNDIKTYVASKIPVFDYKVITEGDFTYGTPVEANYSTRALGYLDLGDLTANLTLNQISDVTETSSATITENISTFSFTDNGANYTTSVNHTSDVIYLQHTGSGNVYIHNMILDFISSTQSNTGIRYTSTATGNINIYNNWLKGNGKVYLPIHINSATPILNFYNNIVSENVGSFALVTVVDINASSFIENNALGSSSQNGFNIGLYAPTLRNNVVINSTGSGYVNLSNATGYNNASEDATCTNTNWSTGTGNEPSINPANEFKSLASDDWNYLRLITGGVLETGGVAPSIAENTTGIRGNTRGVDGTYSIGADEYDTATYEGTFEYGTGYTGGNFPTRAKAYESIPALFTANLIFNQISDTTETSVSVGTENLNTFSFTDNFNGYKTNLNANNHGIDLSFSNGSCNINGDNGLMFTQYTLSSTYASILIRLGSLGQVYNIHHIVCDKNGKNGHGIRQSGISGGDVKIYSCKVFGAITTGFSTYAISSTATQIENCTSDNCGIGVDCNSKSTIVKNVACINNTTDFANISNATGTNNASEDATALDANWSTGTSNITGITPANEFKSLVSDDWNNLRLISGGSLETNGTAPSIAENTTGIRGNARGVGGNYSIGADEYDTATYDGSFTYGTGGTKLTRELAYSELIPALLTANLLLTAVSDTTETSSATISAGLNSFNIIDDYAEYITTAGNISLAYLTCFGPGSVTLKNGVVDQSAATSSNLKMHRTVSAVVGYDLIIHNFKIAGSYFAIPVSFDVAGINYYFYNILADHIRYGFTGSVAGATLDNCTFNDIAYQGCSIGSNACTIRNVSVTNGSQLGTDLPNFYLISNATGTNNASEDASADNANWSTGTGNLININPNDAFLSLVSTDSNYLKPDPDGVLANNGTAPSITENTHGLGGNPRPHTVIV